MINEKQLRTAAEEFNEVLGCTPPIDVKGDAKTLVEKIKEAITLIDPKHDKFSKGTMVVIKAYTPKEEEPEEEEEEETQEEVAERIHQKNIGKKKPKIGADVEEEPEEEPEEEEEEEEEKPKKKEKPKTSRPKNTTGKTKKSIVIEMISTKKGATIEEIAQKIVDEGIDPDYKKNLVVTKLWLSKMGYPTTKVSIEKNPYFKKK